MRRLVPLVVVAVASAACAAHNAQNPRAVLHDYGQALAEGRAEDAYGMLSREAQQTMNPAAFADTVKTNRAEVGEVGKSLMRDTGAPEVTAVVPLASGEEIKLVLEDGKWRVDASALDFYSQATPRQAVIGFIRAFTRRRYDVLLKYTPNAHREGLDEQRLKEAWGEGKPEGKRIEELVEAIRQSLPTATIEEIGDIATMAYGAAGLVHLVRENGAWKIESIQ
jgi:hypothetical protein